MAVLQTDGLTDFLCHSDLLARAVDEFELTVGEENGQRNARETTSSAEIEDLTARTETDHLGNGHRMEHMVLVEVIDILARDDVDLVVPIAIEGLEGVYLTVLLGRQVGEVFADEWLHGQNE